MTRDQFMSRRKITAVEVPGYGTFHFRTLSLAQIFERKEKVEGLTDEEAGNLTIAMRLCDEHGEPIEGLTHADIPHLDLPVWNGIIEAMNAERSTTDGAAAKN